MACVPQKNNMDHLSFEKQTQITYNSIVRVFLFFGFREGK
jgi:hypothetical protein